ncbi:hypothetical protein Lal_00033450 [Lupinus albus]|nr:hypothetical protein Lal_00033450 [Lupinus albus]
MAPFLYLLVAKGFAGMVTKVCSNDLFEGYKVGRHNVEVTNLQFAASKKVISKLTYLQRSFLWSNKRNLKGNLWVAWSLRGSLRTEITMPEGCSSRTEVNNVLKDVSFLFSY